MAKSRKYLELKVVRIGNSRGVRLPKSILEKYAIKDRLLAEELTAGLLLRGKGDRRLGWDATFQEIAREREDWRDFDVTIADGLDLKERW